MQIFNLLSITMNRHHGHDAILVHCTDPDVLDQVSKEVFCKNPNVKITHDGDRYSIWIDNIKNNETSLWEVMQNLGYQGWEPIGVGGGYHFRKADEA